VGSVGASPATLDKQKAQTRLFEYQAKKEIEQQQKERDREQQFRVRDSRRHGIGEMFAVSNAGTFVSVCDCLSITLYLLTLTLTLLSNL
jgi:hypothetical protein